MRNGVKRIRFKSSQNLNDSQRDLIYIAIKNYIIKKVIIVAVLISPLILMSLGIAMCIDYNNISGDGNIVKIIMVCITVVLILALFIPISMIFIKELSKIREGKYEYHIGKIVAQEKQHKGFKQLTNVVVIDSIVCDCIQKYTDNSTNEKYIVIRTDNGKMPFAMKYSLIN